MPITKRNGNWYWGSKGPYKSRNKAEEVQRAAYASGYGVQQKIEKIQMGGRMDGIKRQRTVAEIQEDEKTIKKHYLHPNTEDWAKAPGEHTRGTGPYIDDDPPHQRGKQKPPSPPQAHSHSQSSHLHKEDGGSDGDGLSGTVFTSTNAGIFNPTFGEKKKKKKSGVERLHDFVTDSSPIKLNVEKQEWASTGGQFGHHGPIRIDWEKRKIDEEDNQKVTEHKGEQNQDTVAKDAKDKQRSVERNIEDKYDDDKEKDLKLAYGFGPMGGQGDPLHRANTKDILSRNPRDDEGEEEEENTIPEEEELTHHLTYGKMLRKSAGWDKLFKGLIDEL